MTDAPSHLTALQLDALSLVPARPDAPAVSDRRLRGHLEACAQCRSALEQRQRDRELFVREIFPRTEASMRQRAFGRRSQGKGWLAWLAVPAFALAALLVFVPGRGAVEGFTAKGSEPRLQVYARRNGGVFEVHDSDTLRRGDELRFAVDPGPDRFLIVGSIDGAGHASVYFPYDGSRSAPVGAGRSELPGSIVLDEAPGPERLFAVFTRDPLAAEALRGALEKIGAQGAGAIRTTQRLDLPATLQSTLRFEKGPP